ncbi:MAG: hypothetical protein WC593_10010 [Methanoregula sp.]
MPDNESSGISAEDPASFFHAGGTMISWHTLCPEFTSHPGDPCTACMTSCPYFHKGER